MINNKSFNEWLEKEVSEDNITDYNLIGLMTQWLLDEGYDIGVDKKIKKYVVYKFLRLRFNVLHESLYDCLVTAINSLGEN
jgi:hypothetical protein